MGVCLALTYVKEVSVPDHSERKVTNPSWKKESESEVDYWLQYWLLLIEDWVCLLLHSLLWTRQNIKLGDKEQDINARKSRPCFFFGQSLEGDRFQIWSWLGQIQKFRGGEGFLRGAGGAFQTSTNHFSSSLSGFGWMIRLLKSKLPLISSLIVFQDTEKLLHGLST